MFDPLQDSGWLETRKVQASYMYGKAPTILAIETKPDQAVLDVRGAVQPSSSFGVRVVWGSEFSREYHHRVVARRLGNEWRIASVTVVPDRFPRRNRCPRVVRGGRVPGRSGAHLVALYCLYMFCRFLNVGSDRNVQTPNPS